jgi:DNA repair protein RadC
VKKKDANDPVKKHVTYAYRISMIRDKAIQYEGTVSNAVLGADLVYKTISSCGQDDREQLIIVMLNARNKVVGTNVISVGSITSSPTFLREVFKPAIAASASAVIIGHNHPSGTLDPSADDMLITKKIIAVAKLLDIIVHDHVIVDMASTNYYSFSDRGMMDNLKNEARRFLNQL